MRIFERVCKECGGNWDLFRGLEIRIEDLYRGNNLRDEKEILDF